MQAAALRALLFSALALALGLASGELRAQSEPDPAAEASAEAPTVDPLVEEAEALWSGWEARQGQIEALRRQK